MNNHFTLKHYTSAELFLKEIGPHLHEQEIYNSIFISQLQFEASNVDSDCYFNVLMDLETNTMIFALMALKNSFLYASGIASIIPQEQYKSIIENSVKDFLFASFPFKSIQSYEPVLDMLKTTLEQGLDKKFKFIDDVWSVQINKVQWSERSLTLINNSTAELKLATMNDLQLLIAWTEQYLHDIAEDENYAMHPQVEPLCRERIDQGTVYLLYHNNTPKTMAWKTRPLVNGCSIGFVFTPSEHRHHAYAQTCISMLTKLLLKEYKYISLFVNGNRDPKKNMYTSIGYQFYGKAARYTKDY